MKILTALFFLVVALGLFVGVVWFGWLEHSLKPGDEVRLVPPTPRAEPTEGTTSENTPSVRNPEAEVQLVASGLDTPWSIVFTDENRLLVTERPGSIRVVQDGTLREEPMYEFPEVVEQSEDGAMAMALDPDYPQTKHVYVAVAYGEGSNLFLKVVRLRDAGDRLVEPTNIIDRIPTARNHAGSRVAFGPDGALYVTTGDASRRELAQDENSLAGKILRLNKDGSIPADNPFPRSFIWSLGHRNPQGIAWHPDNGKMYSTEHGPSTFDGPPGGDEVNLIERGANYGWPLVSHDEQREGTEPPMIVYTPAEAPASLMIYSGRAFPEWRGNLFFGALRGQGLMRLTLDPTDPKKVTAYSKLREVQYGRIRDVIEGPDGFIYFTTSNRDGRGTPGPVDDRIFRIRPRG